MQATKIPKAKKNLLLCFDAFGTLFTPSVPIPVAYARAAARHGIDCGDTEDPQIVGTRFKEAFKNESAQNPNYGRSTGLGAEKWWGNVSLLSSSESTLSIIRCPCEGRMSAVCLSNNLLEFFSPFSCSRNS
jgi:hypothetical protein